MNHADVLILGGGLVGATLALALDKHGREVFLADSPYSLQMAIEKFPDIKFHFTSEF